MPRQKMLENDTGSDSSRYLPLFLSGLSHCFV
jgi:hypothetical protein